MYPHGGSLNKNLHELELSGIGQKLVNQVTRVISNNHNVDIKKNFTDEELFKASAMREQQRNPKNSNNNGEITGLRRLHAINKRNNTYIRITSTWLKKDQQEIVKNVSSTFWIAQTQKDTRTFCHFETYEHGIA